LETTKPLVTSVSYIRNAAAHIRVTGVTLVSSNGRERETGVHHGLRIPTKNPSKGVMFYHALHHMFMMHFGKDVEFSTQSCYFTEDKELAEKFLEVVKCESKGHLYQTRQIK
jgi:hypothetical protein